MYLASMLYSTEKKVAMESAMPKMNFGTSAVMLMAPDCTWRRCQESFRMLSSLLVGEFMLSLKAGLSRHLP
jgi:hypothetical protein